MTSSASGVVVKRPQEIRRQENDHVKVFSCLLGPVHQKLHFKQTQPQKGKHLKEDAVLALKIDSVQIFQSGSGKLALFMCLV